MSRALLLLTLLAFACSNLEDAEPSGLNSVVRFYGGDRDYIAEGFEIDQDGGLIIVANKKSAADSVNEIALIKTDSEGNRLWEETFFKGEANAVKVLSDGYLITGDGIEVNPSSTQISELINYQMLLIKTDLNGKNPKVFSKDSTITVNQGAENVILHVDFHGNASSIDKDGRIITLGSYQVPNGTERIITSSFDPATLLPRWSKTLQLENYNYQNTRTLNQTANNLVWASTRIPLDASINSHLGVATVPPNSASPSNYSLLGEKNTESRAHVAGDMQPSATGFGIIGTYAEKGGTNGNIYFVKVDAAGNIMGGSERYFDGEALDENTNQQDKNFSISEDEGSAIISTRDGGFILAGSMVTTPNKGNGGADVLLIKIDAFGNLLWHQLYGGSGNETVSAVRELSDGSFVVCGTAEISNASSVFILKMDKNGKLEN